MDQITLQAPAKINLALSVGAPIADGEYAGYHPIASWMAPLDLCDEVTLTRVPEQARPDRALHLEASHRIAWAHNDQPVGWAAHSDLTVRMLEAVRKHTGHALPAVITVRKAIPAGGGLGGGSSDAVAVLQGLDRLFDLGLSLETRREIAMTIGTDCVFFVDDGDREEQGADFGPSVPPALVSGLGDRIERVERVPGALILIFPDEGCPTGRVYTAYDQAPRGLDEARVRAAYDASAARGALADDVLFNDLYDAALAVTPVLGLHTSMSAQLGRRIHLSGSGSTLWCSCGDEDPARMLSQARNALPVGWAAQSITLA